MEQVFIVLARPVIERYVEMTRKLIESGIPFVFYAGVSEFDSLFKKRDITIRDGIVRVE